ncbi:uncharacterized protein LOC121166956 [Ochotona curzoniae]|uniref:uncharacterized protein LOC121150385 n=1 Tax=Ochotona curzoniae TaxID=130825 RepID=UPI001B34A0ED|nr:uncharacterized protein LOC121150385 [Ochotona curzoniae]XP_040852233.1 uncharacterized protein LOC121166956 [Ochotona curzoniae]
MAPAATHSRPDGRLRCSRLEQAPAARPGGQGRRRSRFLRHEGRRPPARQARSRAAAVGGSPPEVLGPERAVTPRRPRSERGRPRHAARPTRGPLGGARTVCFRPALSGDPRPGLFGCSVHSTPFVCIISKQSGQAALRLGGDALGGPEPARPPSSDSAGRQAIVLRAGRTGQPVRARRPAEAGGESGEEGRRGPAAAARWKKLTSE